MSTFYECSDREKFNRYLTNLEVKYGPLDPAALQYYEDCFALGFIAASDPGTPEGRAGQIRFLSDPVVRAIFFGTIPVNRGVQSEEFVDLLDYTDFLVLSGNDFNTTDKLLFLAETLAEKGVVNISIDQSRGCAWPWINNESERIRFEMFITVPEVTDIARDPKGYLEARERVLELF